MATGKQRKLRSKEDGATQVVFNFDKINTLITHNRPIAIDNDSCTENLYRWYEDDAQMPAAATTAKTVNLKVLDQLLPRRNKLKLDKLDDKVYETFHKKMKKEEKNMTNSDRLKIMSEVDNLRTQLLLLNQYDWIRHLPKVTHINDIKNYDELVAKRQLTIREITRLLKKYDDWKRRNDRLQQDIKEFEHHGINSDDEDESILRVPLDQLQQQRVAARLEKDGPTIVLNLRNGHGILMGPYVVPRVIEYDTLRPPSAPPERKRHITETVERKRHTSDASERKRHAAEAPERKRHTTEASERKRHNTTEALERKRQHTDVPERKRQNTIDDFYSNGKKDQKESREQRQKTREMKQRMEENGLGPKLKDAILDIVETHDESTSDPPIFTEITQPNPKIRGRPRLFTPIRVVLKNDSLHLASDSAANVAFGEPVPDLTPNSFDLALPPSWKAEKKKRKG